MPFVRTLLLVAVLLLSANVLRANAELCGDADANGTVGLTDGVQTLRAAATLPSDCTLARCDVDGSGAITITDGVSVLREVAGLGTGLTCRPVPRDCLSAVKAGNLDAAAIVCPTSSPDDPVIQALGDGSRTLVDVLADPELTAILSGLGIQRSGSLANVCNLRARGNEVAPPGAPRTGSIASTLRSRGLQLINQLLSDTANAPTSFNFEFSCPELAEQGVVVEVDYGDLLTVRYQLNVQAALIHIAAAYDVDFDPAGRLNFQDVFVGNPSLFTFNGGVGAAELGLARQRLDEGILDLLAAFDFIQAETDDQSNDLFSVEFSGHDEEEGALRIAAEREVATALRESLDGTGLIEEAGDERVFDLTRDQRVSFDRFFDGNLTEVRSLVPGFNDRGDIDLCRTNDATFGGVFPDLQKGPDGPDGCVPEFDDLPNRFGPSATQTREDLSGDAEDEDDYVPQLSERCRQLLVGPSCPTYSGTPSLPTLPCVSLRISLDGLPGGEDKANEVADVLEAEGVSFRGPSGNAGQTPACVGWRQGSLSGTREGAQCLVDLLGAPFQTEDVVGPSADCSVDGFPYIVVVP